MIDLHTAHNGQFDALLSKEGELVEGLDPSGCLRGTIVRVRTQTTIFLFQKLNSESWLMRRRWRATDEVASHLNQERTLVVFAMEVGELLRTSDSTLQELIEAIALIQCPVEGRKELALCLAPTET